MTDTLVLQSHRDPLPFSWLSPCLRSVEGWARTRGFGYRFLGDEFWSPVASELLDKAGGRTIIASDLARLAWLRQALDEGFECAVWCDADFLVFREDAFRLPAERCALGRETWVQRDARGRLRVYSKVHNAFLMFRRNDRFLDFYRETAERLLRLNSGRMPPQYLGPKLLSALHNVAQLPVLETAGMLAPEVISDLAAGGGAALDLFRRRSPEPVAAANLCASLFPFGKLDTAVMQQVIDALLEAGI